MIPRTLDALRAAVARVLTARGEAPDALRVTAHRSGGDTTVRVLTLAAGVEVEWIRRTATFAGEAVGLVWREFVFTLEWEFRAAVRSSAGIRRPERRQAAYQRNVRTRAALTAARAVVAGEWAR